MSHQDALPGGHKLRWYEIDHLIGKGERCHTYLATDHNLQRQVVIKEFFPSEICVRNADFSVAPASERVAQSYQGFRDSFISEAKALAQYHLENIVQVHTTLELNETAYMVMTYEKGQSLADMLAENTIPLDQKLLQNIFLPILEGLSTVHKMGVIHGDINPANVIIRHYGAPVLVDFGSPRIIANQQPANQSLASSMLYVPIELLSKSAGIHGVWSDIYSLAATLYRAINREPPVAALERASVVLSGKDDPNIPLSTTRSSRFDPGFLSAVDFGLALKPQHRPQVLAPWADSLRDAQNQPNRVPLVTSNNALLPKAGGSDSAVSNQRDSAEPMLKSPSRVPTPEALTPETLPQETTAPQVPIPQPLNSPEKSSADDQRGMADIAGVAAEEEITPPSSVRARMTRSQSAVAAGLGLLLVSGVYFAKPVADTLQQESTTVQARADTQNADQGWGPSVADVLNTEHSSEQMAATVVVVAEESDLKAVEVQLAGVVKEKPPVVAKAPGEVVAQVDLQADFQVTALVAEAPLDTLFAENSSVDGLHRESVTAEELPPVTLDVALQEDLLTENAVQEQLVSADVLAEQRANHPEKVAVTPKATDSLVATINTPDVQAQISSFALADTQEVEELVSSIACASVDPIDSSLELKGMVTQSALDWLNGGLAEKSATVGQQQLVVLDDIFCAPLTTFKAHADSDLVRVATDKKDNRFKGGDRLVLDVAVDAFANNYVYVDYFAMDGSVLHMLSSQTTMDSEANQLMRGGSLLLGEAGDIERWDISAPFGNELISILVTDSPLDIESGDEAEDAQSYLHRINQELASGDYQAVSRIIPITTGE